MRKTVMTVALALTGVLLARMLCNALVAPVMPFSIARSGLEILYR